MPSFFFLLSKKEKRKNENGRTSKNHSLRLSLFPLFNSHSNSLLSLALSRAKQEAMEDRKKLPMKYVYVSPRIRWALGKKALNAVAGDDRRNRMRDGRSPTAAATMLALTPRMLLLPFAVRSCRPLLEEPTRVPSCTERTESC